MKVIIPKNVNEIIKKINSSGYEAYIVGGCVRDSLQNNTPHDWDITTNATPKEIIEIFKKNKKITNGVKHGTVGIIYDDKLYEVTTYRVDGEYKDNRRPDKVIFSRKLKEDLIRRDFTINALAYNNDDGLIDITGGVQDIENKIIRCVGEADKRFKEDALRILRAMRFSATSGYTIERDTSKSIIKNKELLNNISKERISQELIKIITGNNCGNVLRIYNEVIFEIIPQLRVMYKYNQKSPYHNLDLWEHTVKSLENIEEDNVLRMVMLLHDIGKPSVQVKDIKGICHYNNHAKESEKTADTILNELKFSKKYIKEVKTLIYYHDYFCQPTKVAVKKLLNKINYDNAYKLAKIQLADSSAKSEYKHKEQMIRIKNYIKILDEIKSNEECFSIKELKINGDDIIKLGIPTGEKIGEILEYLLNEVETNKVENQKEELITKVKEYIKL